MLWPSVHLASGIGWCEARSKCSHEIYEFSTSPQACSCNLSINVTYTVWHLTTEHLTAVFSLLGYQWVHPWKLSWVFQPQVILHHSVFLWTASQMQVKTKSSWCARGENNGRKPTHCTVQELFLPLISQPSRIPLIYTVNFWRLKFETLNSYK